MDVNPFKLSGSTDGRPIAVAATSSPGTTIHTAQSTTDDRYDWVELSFNNIDSVSRNLTIEWGGTSASDRIMDAVPIPANSPQFTLPPRPLRNGLLIKAYGSAASIFNISGRVLRQS